MDLIDYTAGGTTALKNWEIMTKASDEKLKYDDPKTFWPFHSVFMTHINNMNWDEIMQHTPNGAVTNIDILHNFGQINTSDIVGTLTRMNATHAANGGVDNDANTVRKRKYLKGKAMFTYLFNSIDTKFKRYFMKHSETHKQYGPIAWKLIMEHSIKSDNQNIRRALCKTHTISLSEYKYDVDQLITSVEENNAILESCGKEDKA